MGDRAHPQACRTPTPRLCCAAGQPTGRPGSRPADAERPDPAPGGTRARPTPAVHVQEAESAPSRRAFTRDELHTGWLLPPLSPGPPVPAWHAPAGARRGRRRRPRAAGLAGHPGQGSRPQRGVLGRVRRQRAGPCRHRHTPKSAWTEAVDAAGGVRDGGDVAELTGLLDLSRWPAGMRVLVRRERPHPGAPDGLQEFRP